MARARTGGGSSGSIWGLVLFGAGFFIPMILAIVFYTMGEAAEQDAAAAESALNQVIDSRDQNNPALTQITAEGSGTTVSQLMGAIQSLRSEVSVLQTDLSGKTTELDATQSQLANQQAATEKAQADLQSTVAAKDTQARDLTAQVNALQSTVNSISAENTRLQTLIDSSIDDVEAQLLAQIEEWKRRTNEAQAEASESNRTVIQLRETIEELRGKTPENVPVTLADATIVAQIPDEDKVYIDIGRDANLTLVMPFQVYDADDLIKIEDPEAEGKAVVAIISINSNSAVGRIESRQPRAIINDGDVLVNVAFDPNRTLAFHVFGQFDINNDGDLDEDGNEQVKSMVTRFDGKLTDELGFATDYLVLGSEPELPVRPDDELDLIKMREFREQLSNYEAYLNLVAEARELGVPVLNQNRFLDLIGWFER